VHDEYKDKGGGMPYTVVISPRGEVARTFTGPMPKIDLVATIEDLLRQRR
jgi:hypothetical protein